jgi:hypothetical protein
MRGPGAKIEPGASWRERLGVVRVARRGPGVDVLSELARAVQWYLACERGISSL